MLLGLLGNTDYDSGGRSNSSLDGVMGTNNSKEDVSNMTALGNFDDRANKTSIIQTGVSNNSIVDLGTNIAIENVGNDTSMGYLEEMGSNSSIVDYNDFHSNSSIGQTGDGSSTPTEDVTTNIAIEDVENKTSISQINDVVSNDLLSKSTSDEVNNPRLHRLQYPCPAHCLLCPSHTNCSKCSPGYVGDLCETVCSNGYQGDLCMKQCPPNCVNSSCHHVTGTCDAGCVPGYEGDLCDQVCAEGTFGLGCEKKCPETCLENICDHVTGKCGRGCVAGFHGDDCVTPCVSGRWGEGCHNNCSVLCLDQSCDQISGLCRKCPVGLSGDRCNVTTRGRVGAGEADQEVGSLPEMDPWTIALLFFGLVGLGVISWLMMACLTFYKNKRAFKKLTKQGKVPRRWYQQAAHRGLIFTSYKDRQRQRTIREKLLRAARKRRQMGVSVARGKGNNSPREREMMNKPKTSWDSDLHRDWSQSGSKIEGELHSKFPQLQARKMMMGARRNSIYLTNKRLSRSIHRYRHGAESDEVDTVTTYPETYSTGDSVHRYLEKARKKYEFDITDYPDEDVGFTTATPTSTNTEHLDDMVIAADSVESHISVTEPDNQTLPGYRNSRRNNRRMQLYITKPGHTHRAGLTVPSNAAEYIHANEVNDMKEERDSSTAMSHLTQKSKDLNKERKSVTFDESCKVFPSPRVQSSHTSTRTDHHNLEAAARSSLLVKGITNLKGALYKTRENVSDTISRLMGRSPPDTHGGLHLRESEEELTERRPPSSLFLLSRMEEWAQNNTTDPDAAIPQQPLGSLSPPMGAFYPPIETSYPPVEHLPIEPDQWPPAYHSLYG